MQTHLPSRILAVVLTIVVVVVVANNATFTLVAATTIVGRWTHKDRSRVGSVAGVTVHATLRLSLAKSRLPRQLLVLDFQIVRHSASVLPFCTSDYTVEITWDYTHRIDEMI